MERNLFISANCIFNIHQYIIANIDGSVVILPKASNTAGMVPIVTAVGSTFAVDSFLSLYEILFHLMIFNKKSLLYHF